MNRKLNLVLAALSLLVASCSGNPATTAAPSFPPGYNEKTLDPSSSNTNIPVTCDTAEGNVYVPQGSMPSQETVSIQCISQAQKETLDKLVKKLPGSTNKVLGAIQLEPSPFTFNKDVTITIPLLQQRTVGSKIDVYVYAPDLSGDLLPISQATVLTPGWSAKAKVKHFSIFVLVGPAEEGTDNGSTEPFTCTDPIGCIDVAPGDPIRIASLLDFTGQGEISASVQDGVNAAVKDFGAIAGHPVEVITLDGGCNEEMGASAAYQVTADPQIPGAIGTICSASALASRTILSDAGYVMVSPGNTRTSFTFTDSRPGFFRVSTPDIYQAQIMADFAFNQLGVRRVGVFYAENEFGTLMADAFSSRFREMGGEIVVSEPVPSGQTEMSAQMDRLIGSEADAVYMPLGATEAGIFTGYVRKFGMEFPLLGTDAININDYFQYAGGASDNVYFTDSAPSVGTNPYAYGYDAARLLLDAIARVAIVDADGMLHIGRQALRDSLVNASFNGQTGTIDCNAIGDCGHASIVIYVIQGGQSSEVNRYTP